jgi:hypothetical protein
MRATVPHAGRVRQPAIARSTATTPSSLVWCPALLSSQHSSGPGIISRNSTGAPGACSRTGASQRDSVRVSDGLPKSM